MSDLVKFSTPTKINDKALVAIDTYKKTFQKQIKNEQNGILLRPSFGTEGVPTIVGVNYFKYNVNGLKLYSYRVDLLEDPNVKTRLSIKTAVEKYLMELEPFKSKKAIIYYRDHNHLYSRMPLPIEDVVIYPLELGGDPKREKKIVELKIQFIKQLNFSDLLNYTQLKNYTPDFLETVEYTNALVAVMGSQVMKNTNVVGLGPNKFFLMDGATKTTDLDKGLYVVMGTFASVRCSFDDVRINLNPTPAIFYKSSKPNGQPMNVLDLIQEFLKIRNVPTERDIRRAQSFIKGCKIYRTYLNRKTTKPILGFDYSNNSETLKFKDANDKLVNVKQYFQERWNIKLKHPTLPLIKIGPEAFLPMELGIIAPHQQYKGDFADPAKIIKITATRPNQKAELISKTNRNLFQKQVDFGTIESQFTVVPARVLNAPTIEYANNQMVTYRPAPFNGRTEKQKGNWNLERYQFVDGAKLTKPMGKPFTFGVVILKDEFVAKRIGDLQRAVPIFLTELGRLGIKIGKNFKKYSIDLNHASVQSQTGLESNIISIAKKAKTEDQCNFLLFILPRQDTPLYSAIKRACDLKVGILNSCSILNTFTKKRRGTENFDAMTYAQMAMKINIKLGGSNHKLSKKDSQGLFDKNNVPIFILGADVTHPTGEINSESVSIASIVGSEDGIFNKFPGSVRIQTGGQEVIADVKSMVLERLENFHKKIGKLPSKVLFYRDGVSEGQYTTILKEELTKIKAAFNEYGKLKNIPKYSPTITFMIVVKRHHTRFIPIHDNADDPKTKKQIAVTSNENVIAGTTVDREITSPAYFDFYVQSQQSLQGTGIPAHYYVLHDENNYTSDTIQKITYDLCHTFSRATKSVKVVPAAYYADLLCTRGRDYIYGFAKDPNLKGSPIERARTKFGENVNPSIKNTMFYI